MKVKAATQEEGKEIGQLIYDTIRAVNCLDYNEKQIEAWAPDPVLFSTFEKSEAFVVKKGDQIVGFGNLTYEGYLHRFYVHKDFQRKGVGSLLLEALENRAKVLNLKEIHTEASVTAKPFFEAKGWFVITSQIKVFRGVEFTNYKMLKKIA